MPQNKYLLYSLFLGLPFIELTAQVNLVPNPSFEQLTSCPEPHIDNQIYLAEPWFSASTGTPDVFNTCLHGNGGFGVPYNRFSDLYYQPSRTGNGYAGILAYNHGTNISTRENMGVPLIQNLRINQSYYIRFFVSISNASIDDAPCFCDGIGAAFTQGKYINNTGGAPVLSDLEPAIDNQGKMLSDTVNWIPVSGCFTNTESEKSHLIIGNFRDNSHTLAGPGCDLSFPNNTYLYIEDVGVWEFDPLPDTVLLCKGDSKQFNVSFLTATYKWNDGSTDSTFTIHQEGIYSVSADMGDCILNDTAVVIEVDDQANLPADTLICQGANVVLAAPTPGEYEWSTGEHSYSIEVLKAGIYSLSVTNECGAFSYESHIETKTCDCPIYVPNVFSPNGDGQNDELLVFAGCDFPLQIKRFQIFDRWGTLLYASVSNLADGIRWDGTSRGAAVATGVYTWDMEYTISPKGQAEQKSLQGNITVLR